MLGILAAALLITSCGSEAPSATRPATGATPSEPNAEPSTCIDVAGSVEASAEGDTTAAETIPETMLASSTIRACRRLTDFDDGEGADGADWFVVDDGVMGGRSAGTVGFVDFAMRFTGDVVTAGGGFTSVRLTLSDDGLAGSDFLVLRVRTDRRIYGLTLEDNAQAGGRTISHGADLTVDGPTDTDGWQTSRPARY